MVMDSTILNSPLMKLRAWSTDLRGEGLLTQIRSRNSRSWTWLMTPQKYLRGMSKKMARNQKEKKLDWRKVEEPPGRKEETEFIWRIRWPASTRSMGLSSKKRATENSSSIRSGFLRVTLKQYLARWGA